MKEKLIKFTRILFSRVIAVFMLVILVIGICYIVALIAGGELAVKIDTFITEHILPVICLTTVGMSFVGMLNMYLRGEKVYVLELNSKNKDEDSKSNK